MLFDYDASTADPYENSTHPDEPVKLKWSMTLDMNGNELKANVKISDGKTLTLSQLEASKNTKKYIGSIGEASEATANLVTNSVVIDKDSTTTGEIDITGTLTATNTVFNGGIVDVTGPAITSSTSVFNGIVRAISITDGVETDLKKGSTFANEVTVSGAVSLYGSVLSGNPKTLTSTTGAITAVGVTFGTKESTVWTAGHSLVTGADGGTSSDTVGGVVSITEGKGLAGNITTHGSAVSIDNGKATETFAVGTVTTTKKTVAETTSFSYADVTVIGTYTAATTSSAEVNGKVTVASIATANAVKTSYAIVTGAIGSSGTPVATVSDGWTVDTTTVDGKSAFGGSIYAIGAGTFTDSVFQPAEVSSETVEASTLTITGATFSANTKKYSLEATAVYIATSNAIEITDSTVDVSSIGASGNGNIKLTNVTGSIGQIYTENTGTVISDTGACGSITIDNSGADKVLSVTGSLRAWRWTSGESSSKTFGAFGDITITGRYTPADTTTSTVEVNGKVTIGNVEQAKNVNTTWAVVTGYIGGSSYHVETLTDGWTTTDPAATYVGKSEFKGDITLIGAGTFTGSTFNTTEAATDKVLKAETVEISGATFNNGTSGITAIVYNIEAFKTSAVTEDTSVENLKITASTGIAGNIWTSGNTAYYNSNVVIDNSSLTTAGNHALRVGIVNATNSGNTIFGNVTIKGYYLDAEVAENVVDSRVTASNIDYAEAVRTSYAVVEGNIGSSSYPVATVYDGWIGSETTVAGCSSFSGDITASSNITFNNSVFGSIDVKSTVYGSIVMTGCTGSLKTITANVTTDTTTSSPALKIDNTSLTSGNLVVSGAVTAKKDSTTNAVIVINSSKTAGATLTFNGTITGETTIRDGLVSDTSNGGTLFVATSDTYEFVGHVNVYGGTYGSYGETLNSFGYYGTAWIHGGVFYVCSSDAVLENDTDLRNVAVKIHGSTNYPVEINVMKKVELTGSMIIGPSSATLPSTGKIVTVKKCGAGDTSGLREIVVPYDSIKPGTSSYYYSYAINVHSGYVVFDGIYVTGHDKNDALVSGYTSTDTAKILIAVRGQHGHLDFVGGSDCNGKTISY